MGYGNSTPDETILQIVKETEKELLEVIKPAYVYKVYKIQNVDLENGVVTLCETRLAFHGKDIADLLFGCEKAVVMACTTSSGVDRMLRVYSVSDMTKAVVADSLASTAVEQICDEAQKEISDTLGGYTTRRFSCGYGDFPLEAQTDIIANLDAVRKIGLEVTQSLMLVPTKSVTAVFGISENELDEKRKSCENCNLYENCKFRKRGERCENQ